MNKILILVAYLLFSLTTIAQTQNDSTRMAIEQINRIKLDTDNYLYTEVTMSDWMEAYKSAKALLKEQLSTWLAKNQTTEDVKSYVARSDEHIFEIKALRGNRYRAFVYIKKSDILSFNEERQLVTITSDDMKDKVIEENLFKLPDEKPTEDSLSVAIAASTGNRVNPSPSSAPVAPAPVVSPVEPERSHLEMEMLAVSNFESIESFVTDHQNIGVISVFGKYASRPKSGTYYMFVYNRNAEIPAYLRCDDGVITNLKTGKTDTMDAYKNCGAIWFK